MERPMPSISLPVGEVCDEQLLYLRRAFVTANYDAPCALLLSPSPRLLFYIDLILGGIMARTPPRNL